VLVMQSRAERKPLEESPDTAERGGRESDPAKAAGKCHRKQPPAGATHVPLSPVRVKRCGKSAPAAR